MTTDDLRSLGFLGGARVRALCEDMSAVPDVPGVYVLARVGAAAPAFAPASTGRVGRRGDPSVPLEVLAANWVDAAEVVYIGKAALRSNGAALRKRLREYMRFGQGRADNHWGGRLVWQLADAADLAVYWKPHPDPRGHEAELIAEFRARNGGRRPFANLVD